MGYIKFLERGADHVRLQVACPSCVDLDRLRACRFYPLSISTCLDVALDHANCHFSMEPRNGALQQGGFTSARRTHHVDRADSVGCQRLLDLLGDGVVGCQDVLSNGYFRHGSQSSCRR